MPAPTKSALTGLCKSAVRSAGLEGEDAPKLGEAMADLFSQALAMFVNMGQVLPGIPAAVDPTSGAGATAGPGLLLPPPAGAPSASQLEGLANTALRSAGLEGENIPELAKVLSQATETALSLFCAQVQIAPGIAVAGFATAAPGRLI